jgi:hypothetical protein
VENRKPKAPPKTNPTTKYSTAISVPSFPQLRAKRPPLSKRRLTCQAMRKQRDLATFIL